MPDAPSDQAALAIREREEGQTTRIPLALVLGHPDNANKMGAGVYKKLLSAMREKGRYPALIVRPHPTETGAFQVLDGHFRCQALRDVGAVEAVCQVWHVDDDEALVLLASLNRLRGRDDPKLRSSLIKKLAAKHSLEELGRRLPETSKGIASLMRLGDSSTSVSVGGAGTSGVSAFTVFLTPIQRARLDKRLKAIATNASLAFCMLLELDHDVDEDEPVGIQGGEGDDGGLEGAGEVSLSEPPCAGSDADLASNAQLAVRERDVGGRFTK